MRSDRFASRVGRRDDHDKKKGLRDANQLVPMHTRRFTRMTNAFSKRVDEPRPRSALHFMYYSFWRLTKRTD